MGSSLQSKPRSSLAGKIEPEAVEVLSLCLCSAMVFAATIILFGGYADAVSRFGDNGAYTSVASAIRHWDFRGLQVKQFWGYPYAMAAVSIVTGLTETRSLLVVSFVFSLLSAALASRLWGGWVASLFVLLNFDWMQRSFLGGSEPLFVVLLFASFYFERKEKWLSAALFASLATVTRPVGLLALINLGAFLLRKRKYKELSLCAAIGLAVGVLYVLPFWIFFHDPLYEFHRYKAADWGSGPPIGLPLFAIGSSFVHSLHYHAPWTNIIFVCGWVLLVTVGAIAMTGADVRDYASQYPIEFWFAVSYIAFLFTYNSREWALAEFPRFAIPVLPVLLIALSRWLPRDRRFLWTLGAVSPILAAASALGIRNFAHALLK